MTWTPFHFVQASSTGSTTPNRVPLSANISFVESEQKGRSEQAAKNRTLVLIFSWMLAKGQHLEKFTQFYGNYGYDVLLIKTLPMQLVFPKKGTMQNAEEVVQFIANRPDYSNILVHGFSVGAYAFGEVLVQMSKDKVAAKKISPLFRGKTVIFSLLMPLTETFSLSFSSYYIRFGS